MKIKRNDLEKKWENRELNQICGFSKERTCTEKKSESKETQSSNAFPGNDFIYHIIKWKSESEVAQSYPTLCDPVDCSPPGSSVHGILQARILEWVAVSFSRASSWPRDRTRVSRIAGTLPSEPPGNQPDGHTYSLCPRQSVFLTTPGFTPSFCHPHQHLCG